MLDKVFYKVMKTIDYIFNIPTHLVSGPTRMQLRRHPSIRTQRSGTELRRKVTRYMFIRVKCRMRSLNTAPPFF